MASKTNVDDFIKSLYQQFEDRTDKSKPSHELLYEFINSEECKLINSIEKIRGKFLYIQCSDKDIKRVYENDNQLEIILNNNYFGLKQVS